MTLSLSRTARLSQRRPSGHLLSLVLLGLLPVLATCSGGSSSTGTTQAAGRQVLLDGSWQAGPAPTGTRDLTGTDLVLFPIALSTAGTLDATVNWGSQSNDIEFAIHQGTCTFANLGSGACTELVASGRATKGSSISKALAAGSYTLFVVNYGPGSESGTYQVGVTR